jgi:hypothetical protein
MNTRTLRLGAALAGIVGVFGAFSGTALATTPSCAFTDAKGDAKDTRLQVVNPMGATDPLALPGQPNEDLLGYTVTSALDGTVSVTAKLANMSKTVPQDANGVSWYLGYTIEGVDAAEFVSADTTGSDYTFSYGHIDTKTGVYTTDGTTSGKVVEGPNGTVKIDIPDALKGDTLDETYVTSFQDTSVGSPDVVEFSSLDAIDSAPDQGGEGGTNNAPCLVS